MSYTWVGGTPTTETTRYVGSLYEISETQATNHIFLGDTRIASITNGSLKYYHDDHLGGTNLVTDSIGAIKQVVEYDPYGSLARNTITGTPDEQAWHLFTSKQFDDEVGLYYYGARYYSPVLGRFIQPDTMVEDFSNPQALNRYSYVLNNPINRIDPTGHWSWKKFWNSFARGFAGAVAAIVLGPAGMAMVGATMAGVIGGAVGGAITGGLEGGWQGALIGTVMGGALGGIGGWAVGGEHYGVLAGMFVAGAAVAGMMDSWDSFVGGLTGGIGGSFAGRGIVGQKSTTAQGGEVDALADKAYERLSSGAIGDAELMSMYNNVRSSVTEKVAIAKALVRAAESTVDFVGDEAGLIATGDESFLSGIGGIVKGGVRNIASNFMAKVSTAGGFARITQNIAGKITGYTEHGLTQALGRNGRGVGIKAIFDAVKNPLTVQQQINGTIKYAGEQATVILNKAGQIVTTWGKARY